MSVIKITESVLPLASDVELGDKIVLTKQERDVVACQETGVKMLNIDADELAPGDLKFIKALGLTISNPSTDKPVALGVDFQEDTWGHRVKRYFEDDEDDDSGFFGSTTGAFLGGLGSSGFGSFGGGGGFGGFGGGSFSGGGASRGF